MYFTSAAKAVCDAPAQTAIQIDPAVKSVPFFHFFYLSAYQYIFRKTKCQIVFAVFGCGSAFSRTAAAFSCLSSQVFRNNGTGCNPPAQRQTITQKAAGKTRTKPFFHFACSCYCLISFYPIFVPYSENGQKKQPVIPARFPCSISSR